MSDKDKKRQNTETTQEGYTEEVSREEIEKTVSEIEATGPDSDGGAVDGLDGAATEPDDSTDNGPKHRALLEELKKANDQAKENYERYLRSMADLDNFKKRIAKETQDNRKFANEELIKSLLPVVDNLERALFHSEGNPDPGALVEGVRMVQKQFMDTLAKYGVEPVVALGKPFDPNFHQALMQVKTNDSPPNTVVSEITKGYLLNGRLIRPSMVGVSVKDDGSPEESPWGDEEYHTEEDIPDTNNGDTIDDTE